MKLALAQAAEMIGVHRDTLKDWSNRTPPVGPSFTRTVGGHRRYDMQEIEAWMKQNSSTKTEVSA